MRRYDQNSVKRRRPPPGPVGEGTVVPLRPGEGRPEPPAELSQREAELWREIVSSRPPNHFGRETFPLLRAYCTTAMLVEDQAAEVRALRHAGKAVKRASDEHRRTVSALGALATKLRLVARRPTRVEESADRATPRRRLWSA